MNSDNQIVKTLVLDGGDIPQKASEHARGHDVFAAAIVSAEFDRHKPWQRSRLWDFQTKPHVLVEHNILIGEAPPHHEQHIYVLRPGEKVTIGMGVVFGMTPAWCAWIARRSSTARKELDAEMQPPVIMHPRGLGSCILPEMLDILDLNIEVPIDPDFRGEPIVILKNIGDEDFHIAHRQRITQLLFMGPENNWYPFFEEVGSVEELGETKRANGNHGSTGDFRIGDKKIEEKIS